LKVKHRPSDIYSPDSDRDVRCDRSSRLPEDQDLGRFNATGPELPELGILSILRTTETPFTPQDVDLLTQASGQIAIAVKNALAYHEISELKDKLSQEKLYLEEEIRSEWVLSR
jgi:GAF domain-containing protein